ncbi:hypothetical protein BJF86_02285 [Serinicoccus sp. CNJ-927]|nr:hypothetical protein BJF86_02285 [Serinicoccus sp. CNJ-927]
MDGGLALRLPAYSGAAAPPRAALQLASSGPHGPLDVGVQDFEFGTDFRLDAESQGTEVDGGNNLIQRGLASDPGQFKIDVDGGRVGCRVAGSEGVVEARISSSVRPDTWYRARCSRNGDVVDVRIESLESLKTAGAATATGSIGDISFDAGLPLSLGGKVRADGELIASATDQFNGVVADPVLTVRAAP